MKSLSLFNRLPTRNSLFSKDIFGWDFREFENLFNHLIWKEVDGKYSMTLEIPGFKKEEIKIEIEDDIIVINAENKRGQNISSVSGSYSLPANVQVETLDAVLEDGILTLSLSKKDQSEDKKTKIVPVK